MTKFDHLLAAFGLRKKAPAGGQSKRYFGATHNRLTADWAPLYGSADANIQDFACELRNRSRDLERNNDYARRFLTAAENNILGADGFKLQMKVRTASRKKPDKNANMRIEGAWNRWNLAEFCSLNQQDHFIDVQKLVLRTTFRDGGIFIRKAYDRQNPFTLSLELLEYDYLDVNYTVALENGNRVFMGVEKDTRNRIVAYHMFDTPPGARLIGYGRNRIRVPATDVIHYFIKERVNQSIGVPQFCSAMYRMHFLEKYEQAELSAARSGAEKGGWFQSTRGDSFEGPEEVNVDEDGNKVINTLNEFEPGSFDELPPDMTFVPYDPKHPNQAYGDFVKNALLGISAGLNIDYPTLTNDLSAANYSSMRTGKLEAQETWKAHQGHMLRNFMHPVFSEWLMYALDGSELQLSGNDFERLNKPKFIGRRWPWVDPEADLKAAKIAIDEGLDTRSNIAAQNGIDFEENIETMKYEQELMDAAQVKLPVATAQAKPAQTEPKPDAGDEDPDEEEDQDD